jgi:uncharacterized membrane protein YfcA
MIDPRVSLAGLVVGFITGLSGIGGSALLAPILILVLGVNPSVAVGTDLLYSVPTKLLASFVHIRQKTVEPWLVGWLCAGGIPGAVVGLFIFAQLRHGAPANFQPTVKHLIGIAILIACAIAVVGQVLYARRAANRASDQHRRPIVMPVLIGAFVGVLVAVTSIGGGSVTLPLLLLTLPAFALRRLIGTEIVFALVIVFVASFGHVRFGDVDPHLVTSLLVGSLPGVYVGSTLCGRMDETWLSRAVLLILAYAGFKLL